MYDIMLTNCTTNLCVYLLSLLEEKHYNTDFIRHVWQSQGIGNEWCACKCLEVINRENYTITTEACEHYHIRYIERNEEQQKKGTNEWQKLWDKLYYKIYEHHYEIVSTEPCETKDAKLSLSNWVLTLMSDMKGEMNGRP